MKQVNQVLKRQTIFGSIELNNKQQNATEKTSISKQREHSDLTIEKKISNISRTRSLQSISSIITQHLQRATVSSILALLEKYGLGVSASSLNMLRISLNTSLKTPKKNVSYNYEYSKRQTTDNCVYGNAHFSRAHICMQHTLINIRVSLP